MASVAALTVACSNDDVDAGRTIFTTEATPNQTEFDQWLQKNYTEPFNIRFQYKYIDQNSNMAYNVTPAELSRSIAMAKLVKHVWLDAYTELMGEDFLKRHSFREFQLIGSAQYNGQGSVTLGFAEGGIRVNLFQVNDLDVNDLYVEQLNPYSSGSNFDLNKNFFHTMHHEFAHILTQITNYSTDFRALSAGKFHSADWVNLSDSAANKEGFVTAYGSSEYNEDFAEVFACYVTDTDTMWNQRLNMAQKLDPAVQDSLNTLLKAAQEKIDNHKGDSATKADSAAYYIVTDMIKKRQNVAARNTILAKLALIRTYLQTAWGVDIDRLRQIVLRRESEIGDLDLTTLD